MDEGQRVLLEVGQYLRRTGYEFVTVTPESHARVNARYDSKQALGLRDVFGWNRPFVAGLLPAPMFDRLHAVGALEREGGLFRSRVRFSSLGPHLLVHSRFPTQEKDAVFFGPDTYRFAGWLGRTLPPCQRLVDVGCGTGAGAIAMAGRCGQVVFTDINPRALRFAAVNAKLAGLGEQAVQFAAGDLYAPVAGPIDCIVANPPYLVDRSQRVYRDGGGFWGMALAVRIVREGLPRLRAGGTLLLCTGAPVREGTNLLMSELGPILQAAGAHHVLEELDPDVFGGELDLEPYASGGIDRLAAIGLRIEAPRSQT
jgi:SAM-dependent methyltransferase